MTLKKSSAADSVWLNCEKMRMPENVNDLIDYSVEQNAEKVLWTFIESQQVVTYREFHLRLSQFANYLDSIDVQQGTHVALMLGNTPEFFYFWLALARLGAVMVPVNTRYTPDELKFVLNDSDATHLITDSHGFELFNQVSKKIFNVNNERVIIIGSCTEGLSTQRKIDSFSSLMPASKVTGKDLLNIQYTSGTTGFPKGCMLTHEYWVKGAVIAVGLWPSQPKKILSDSPFFYIDPQWELLTAIYVGGELVAAPRPSLSRFMSYIRDYRIDYCSLWEALALRPASADDESETLLYSWTFGLNPAEHAEVERRFNLKAREMYAMTEIGCTLVMPWSADHMVGSGSCGIVAPCREVRLINPDDLQEVAAGEVGELCVRGEGLFRGYYNRDEANAEAFITDGWFRTGDLFRMDEEGYFYIVGRIKDMIRRSSENIAAREVEATIEQIDGIAAVAVVGVPDPLRIEEVKAYIVLHDANRSLEPQEVIEFCKLHLASFKLPRFIEFINEMPLTPSGKIAKKKLGEDKADLRVGSYDFEVGRWI
ncbi:class I adenylate-forming enzyme family protein [Pseudomonas syringae group genomosp. 3]|uniref:AMP-dependent synthetase and ligase n=1 Tax=Pseudomonas syringae pv. primulae TaxID=251707 RepID=A0A3M4S5K3_9PSED|nr:class I adenylate-forming enzyme family protein [Pseudomonas syringae group genomosp. 3]RMO76864.1 AMP-dependent synthetase and ligase [Pseudomonas syringae pv. primulae]RMR10217.1 AMP-dependent synthetase and ligase [Pseudomonas syringae pv. primulae]RMU40411.1 AMP-dependent synthetase and ligase [Pseudomonas syringae pv. primulae]